MFERRDRDLVSDGLAFAPFRLSRAVYGVLLNHRPALLALGDAMLQPPYKGAPKAPVLYLKPRNTIGTNGSVVIVPNGVHDLEIGASLGVVIGKTTTRVTAADAMDYVAGYTIVNDICVPHEIYYRPSVRMRARDGFCPIGPRVVPARDVTNPNALAVRVFVDRTCVHETDTADRVRDVAHLVADVSGIMTLSPGDVLMLGVSAGAPRATPGQSSAIEIDGIGRLENLLVTESSFR